MGGQLYSLAYVAAQEPPQHGAHGAPGLRVWYPQSWCLPNTDFGLSHTVSAVLICLYVSSMLSYFSVVSSHVAR